MNELTNQAVGSLPPAAPLANPYVPFQQENPPVYDAPKALVRGTLFPGLELPFMSLINSENQPVTPLIELQTLAFAIQDLVLYLDTHRKDTEALKLYRSYQDFYRQGKEKYEKEYGPLTHNWISSGDYEWLNDPWPWEYAANKEG